jgi:hypothetical protein
LAARATVGATSSAKARSSRATPRCRATITGPILAGEA